MSRGCLQSECLLFVLLIARSIFSCPLLFFFLCSLPLSTSLTLTHAQAWNRYTVDGRKWNPLADGHCGWWCLYKAIYYPNVSLSHQDLLSETHRYGAMKIRLEVYDFIDENPELLFGLGSHSSNFRTHLLKIFPKGKRLDEKDWSSQSSKSFLNWDPSSLWLSDYLFEIIACCFGRPLVSFHGGTASSNKLLISGNIEYETYLPRTLSERLDIPDPSNESDRARVAPIGLYIHQSHWYLVEMKALVLPCHSITIVLTSKLGAVSFLKEL